MNKTFIIIVLVVIITGGYFLVKNKTAQAPEETSTSGMPVPGANTPEMIVTEEEDTSGLPGANQNVITPVVIYGDAGYSPSILTIKAGDTVTFKNQSAQNMWTASAMHPAHILYSGTSLSDHCPDTANISFDACKGTPSGDSWSFTFTKVGTWSYHDHLHPALFGKVVVE